jgi:hypothetical protein
MTLSTKATVSVQAETKTGLCTAYAVSLLRTSMESNRLCSSRNNKMTTNNQRSSDMLIYTAISIGVSPLPLGG